MGKKEFQPTEHQSPLLLPASSAQQRLWAIHQFDPQNKAYNIPYLLTCRGNLNQNALEETLFTLTKRHVVLRSSFKWIDGELLQEVQDDWRPVIRSERIQEQAELTQKLQAEINEPFDLERLPLCRFLLIEHSQDLNWLVFTFHHAIFDGWSASVFFKEFKEIYSSLVKGTSLLLPDLSSEYASYFNDEKIRVQDQSLDPQLEYWKNRLSGELPKVILPTDRYRSAVKQGDHGGLYEHDLPKELSTQIKSFAKKHNTSLFITLLACFKSLLHRYTGQNDLLVGIPFANRNYESASQLLGFMVNTLAIRTSISDELSFEAYLAQVHTAAIEAYRYSDLPFDAVVRAVQPRRDHAASPIVQVMFNQKEDKDMTYTLPNLQLEVQEYPNDSTQFELVFNICDLGDSIRITVVYDSGLFQRNSIERFVHYFEGLAGSAVANPQERLAALSFVDKESLPVYAAPSQNLTSRSHHTTLHKLFEEQAEQTPDAIAVEYMNDALTYKELNQSANRLAHQLIAKGVQRNTLVGLATNRSLALPVGILGILKAGGAYVPMDPTYPADRLQYLATNSDVRFILVQEEVRAYFPHCQAELISMDSCLAPEEDNVTKTVSLANPAIDSAAEDMAYVIYTSGSTGKPKGCVLQHRNVIRLFESVQFRFEFKSSDAWTLFHSYAFDFSVWEFWGALLNGGRLVIVPKDIIHSPDRFLELISQRQVTVLNQTPSAFWPLMETALSSEHTKALCLRYVVFGGERLDFERLQPWVERFGEASPQLINMYGITETTVHNTFRRVGQKDTMPGSISCIGEPLSDLKLYVLDTNLNPLPIGIPGELYVSGPGVAKGYLHRPELTKERFIPNPFLQGEHDRLYRTGDQVRQISDNDYEYWGRLDDQVKIRGHRIELSEVESAVRDFPEIKSGVVIPYGEKSGDLRLIAYVVMNDTKTSTLDLHLKLRSSLPAYMIPAAFVEVSHIPMTPNGKLDKSKLPSPVLQLDTEESYVPAQSPLEQQLAEIWSDVLGVTNVGIEHNFFQIGGDSIRSIQLISAAQKKGIKLTVDLIFQYPTIKELMSVLQSHEEQNPNQPKYKPFSLVAKESLATLPSEAVDAYPLTLLQQGMLFHSEYNPENATYFLMNSVIVEAPYDRSLLENALFILTERHDILRTSFLLDGWRETLQVVHPAAETPINEIDIRSMTSPEQAAWIKQWWRQEIRKLDLSRSPAFTLTALRCTDDIFQLSLCTHHALLDGWSVASFFTELLHSYDLLLENANRQFTRLLPLSVSFAEYVEMEQELLESAECQTFWQDWLKHCSIAKVPRLAMTTNDGDPHFSKSIIEEIPTPLLQGLERFSKSIQVPLRSILLAAHFKVLSLLIGDRDITTGVVYNGRPEASDGENVLGLFLNTLPFRCKLENVSWIDFIKRLWAQENKLLPYRRYPLAKIIQDHGGAPLFETLFNYTNFHVYQDIEQSQRVRILNNLDFSAPIYPLVVDFYREVHSEQLKLALVWDVKEFDSVQMESMMKLYLRTLRDIARTPHLLSTANPSLKPEEIDTIIYEWNRHDSAVDKFIPVHHLFERQAILTPNRIALVDRSMRLTYEELNVKANQIAHRLIDTGITPESLVGIMLNKSWKAVAVILGILKAGGAYVPLDPDYPQERLEHMIAESGIKTVITEEDFSGQAGSELELLLSEIFKSRQSDNPVNHVLEEQLAYVIFTSGSTGKPKGAMNTQGGLSKAYHAWDKAYDLKNIGCNLQMTSFAFDVFTADVFRTLCSGGKLLLCPQELLMNAPELYALMKNEQVDFAFFLPAVMRNLVHYLENNHLDLSLMKVMIVGADYWFVHEYRRLQRICGSNTRVINSYGVAEATVDSIYFEGDGDCIPDQSNIPIGRPFLNMASYILDADLKPLYPGMIGELYIGGSCVGSGYIQRPELTAEKFIDSPFNPGERLYKTGDLARYWPDGTIEFIGRQDHQYKIRGYRVELGEIESVLRSSEGVKDAVVLASTKESSQGQLVAYLTLDRDTDGDAQQNILQIKTNLKKKLPEYMIPHSFILLAEMPLNPNGKIDRKQISMLDGVPIQMKVPFIAARNKIEMLLSSIVGSILEIDHLSMADHLFDLGADSLAALKILSRIRSCFNIELTLKTIFDHPTLAELSRVIQIQSRNMSPVPLKQQFVQGDSLDAALLSYAQQRIWFFEALQPGTSTYHVPVVLDFKGSLDCEALESCFNALVSRHDVLRTSFRLENGYPVQRINTGSCHLEWLEHDTLHKVITEEELQPIIDSAVRRPFDLNGESLLRVQIIGLDPMRHILILTMHHLITDGWSVDLILRELSQLYNAKIDKKEPKLPELAYRYVDFAVWQRQLIESGGMESQMDYWSKKLAQAPEVLQLPLDYPRPMEKSYRGEARSRLLPQALIHRLQKLVYQRESTLFTALLSAYFVLLTRYTGQEDIIVGTPVTNRNHLELEELAGMFVNTLALRSNPIGSLTYLEFLDQVTATVLEAISHSDVPFEHLVAVLSPNRNLSRTPLFQTMFLLEQSSELPEFLGVAVERKQADSEASKCDITLAISLDKDSTSVTITYDPDLFHSTTIANMLENFETLLESIVESPEAELHQLRILSPSQQAEIWHMGTGDKTNNNISDSLCLHELFVRQARMTPEAIACVCGSDHLTYRELDERSTQLAHFLGRFGIEKESFVGLLLDNSVEMIVGLLGILKTGGAYVPLDPSMPQERISYVLENSNASLIVTQGLLAEQLDTYCPIVRLDEDWPMIESESKQLDASNSSPESAAYVLYTTGSTGRPKGVIVEHRQIVNYVTGVTDRLDLYACSSFAMAQPLVVDSCQTVLFPAFYTGGTLHIITSELAMNAVMIAAYFKQNPIDCLKIAPSHLSALQKLAGIHAVMPKQRLILGGEPSNPVWIRELLLHKGNCLIYNHYGPTETTVGISTFHITNADSISAGIPIGYPLPNVQFYVVDSHDHLAPRGVAGELWVGGSAVTRGYLGQEQLTAEKYVYASFTGGRPERLYRTGDQVRMLACGAIEFLGRLDDQVKINGYRVEPSELVYILSQMPDIREVVILPKLLPNGARSLAAYLVPKSLHKPSHQELNNYVLKHLPAYFLPHAYVWLEELPRTLQGKVNRSALPEPDIQSTATKYRAAENDTERSLLTMWSQVLGHPQIGVDDNFFQLGGNSILSMQLIALAHEKGWHLSLKQLFQYQTIAELSQFLQYGGERTANQPSQVKTPLRCLVPFSVDHSKIPFFCVHPITGHVHSYYELAQRIQSKYRFIGIQSPMVDIDPPSFDNLETLAQHYVEAVQAEQPHGPYHLGGWSLGGLIAYEMAQILKKQKEEVQCLIIMDKDAYPYPFVHQDEHLLSYLFEEEDVPGEESFLQMNFTDQLNWLLSQHQVKKRYNNNDPGRIKQHLEIIRDHIRLMSKHILGPYDGHLTVIASQDTVNKTGNDPALGWRKLAESVRAITVPGNHDSLIQEPFVERLASEILQNSPIVKEVNT